MKGSAKILKGTCKLKTELIYDESEFSIQRDVKPYSVSLVICLFLILQLALSIYNNYDDLPLKNNPEKVWIYIYLAVSILLIIVSACAYLPLLKFRKKNRNIYKYEDIQSVEIQKIKNKNVVLFRFTDDSQEKIKFSRGEAIEPFVEFITVNVTRPLKG